MNSKNEDPILQWLFSNLDEIIDMSGESIKPEPKGEVKTIYDYRTKLIEEMTKLEATENDINLINDTLIQNSIKNNRTPKDVAWAILQ